MWFLKYNSKWVWLVLPLVGFGLWSFGSRETEKEKPNVLFILTDDQGWGDLSLHGNPHLKTPNLDRLATQGAQFERFYVSPLCAPTRASLLTGRYHLRTGTVSVSRTLEVMNAEEVTLAEIFKENGYATGCFGKWHNGEHFPNTPNGQGFDEFLGFCAGHLTNYFDSELLHNETSFKSRGYITDILADAAMEFMTKNKSEPFFCYVPFNAPHTPHQVPEYYFQKYKKQGLTDELASIYGMVENVDDNVGRLLKKLDELKLTENTIVIFATDNGPNGNRYNGDMKGVKGSVDEGGVRVPFFVRWPKKIQSKAVKSMAMHIDLLPSLVELCGFPTPKTLPLDGVSFAGKLLGKSPDVPDDRTLFTHVAQLDKNLKPTPGALRTNRYRWVWKGNEPELYDMLADPSQKTNRANQNPKLMKTMKEQFDDWFGRATRELSMSERPVPVGFAGKEVELAAHEANFSGNLRYKEGHGWAHDWLTQWTAPSDQMEWQVESQRPVRYIAYLRYTCPEGQTGSRIQLSTGSSALKATIQEAFDPPMLPSPDRVTRKEAYEKEWRLVELGEISVPAGVSTLRLSALSVKADEVAEIKSVVLRPKGN